MKDYQTGVSYIRKVARSVDLIADSDNDDTLVQRVGQALKALDQDAVKKIARSTSGDNSHVEEKKESEGDQGTGPQGSAGQNLDPRVGGQAPPSGGQVFGK